MYRHEDNLIFGNSHNESDYIVSRGSGMAAHFSSELYFYVSPRSPHLRVVCKLHATDL